MSDANKPVQVEDLNAYSWYWADVGSGSVLLSSAPRRPVILAVNKRGQLVTADAGLLQPVNPESTNMRVVAAGPSMCRVLASVYAGIKQVRAQGVDHVSTEADNRLSDLQNIIVLLFASLGINTENMEDKSL